MNVQIQPPSFLSEKFEKLNLIKYGSQENMSAPQPCTTPPTPPPQKDSYSIRLIRKDEEDNVLNFLRKFFFKDEPINDCVNLIETEESRCYDLEYYSTKYIKEGVSLMAVSAEDEIIGICLNSASEEVEEEEFECDNPKFKKILKLLDYIDSEGSKVIEKNFSSVSKIMSVKIISVDSSWRGKGIAKELLDSTRKIGLMKNLELMRVDCTSHFTAKAMSRLGFHCVYQLKYADFKEDGKPLFLPKYPHHSCEIYVKKIMSDSSKDI